MRYFFLIFTLLGLLTILVLPNRLGKFSETEWRIFPDMDEQDKVLGQRANHFFADGRGARLPDPNLVPMGYTPLNEENRNQLPDFGFTQGDSYVFTGKDGEGIPKELGLTSLNDYRSFLAHGEERYQINCSACHGISADGNGVVKARATVFSAIPSLMTTQLKDGGVFDIITNGRGLMGSFKHNTSIKDRWAIVAYLRSIQQTQSKTAAE